MPSVLIVGAGLAGLACARSLAAAGWTVTLIEKGRSVGGRLATRRLGAASFDTGAQFFTARDPGFDQEVRGWAQAGIATVWCDGFPLLGSHAEPDGHVRWRIAGGMNRLAKQLADDVSRIGRTTIHCSTTVTGMTPTADGWAVSMITSTGGVEDESADAVVLTAPAPQAAQLLVRSGLTVDPALAAVRYDPCLCLLIDEPAALGPLLPFPGGWRIADDHRIAWIASQRAKGLRRDGDGLVVHARSDWSTVMYERSDGEVIAELVPAVVALLQREGVSITGADVRLKRWRYSLPVVGVPEPCLRVLAPSPLILAGDAFGQRPRVEGAWMSGIAAAGALTGN